MKSLLLIFLLVGFGLAAGNDFEGASMPEKEVSLMLNMGVDELYLDQRGWIVEKVKNIISSIGSRYQPFRDWIQTKLVHKLEEAKPHAAAMKEMALVFIKEMAKVSAEVVIKTGYKYFEEHKSEIGLELWQIIEALYRKYLEGKLDTSKELYNFSVAEFDMYLQDGYTATYLLSEGFILQSIGNFINSIQQWYNPFKSWISTQMKNMLEVVQPQLQTVRQMAITFVKEMSKVAIEAVIEAGYLFFREQQNELGEALWRLVDEVYRKYLEDKLQYIQ